MITITPILDRRTIKKDKTYPVKLIIYFTPKILKGIKGVSVTEADWALLYSPNLKNEKLIQMKKTIDNEINRAYTIIKNLEKYKKLNRKNFLILYDPKEEIKFVMTIKSRKKSRQPQIYELLQNHINQLKEIPNGTSSSYENALKSFKIFKPKVSYHDLTPTFFRNYEIFMLSQGKSLTTVGIYCRALRITIIEARDKGYIKNKNYPFGLQTRGKYMIPTGNINSRKALETKYIKEIIAFTSTIEDEIYARDIWLFSFYCNGMNMRDIFHLKLNNIQNEMLSFQRIKTHRTARKIKSIEIPLSTPITTIINKWGSKKASMDQYMFPLLNSLSIYSPNYDFETEAYRLISNEVRRINRLLHIIEKKLNLPLNFTTTIARHSWATHLEQQGVPLAFISEGLGHTSIVTTQHYLCGFTKEQKKTYSKLITDL